MQYIRNNTIALKVVHHPSITNYRVFSIKALFATKFRWWSNRRGSQLCIKKITRYMANKIIKIIKLDSNKLDVN